MQFLKSPPTLVFASNGSIQLFVGPASSLFLEQMYVNCSTLATSFGLLLWRKQPGLVSWLSRKSAPSANMDSISRACSDSEPSHQTTLSGRVSAAHSSTQASNRELKSRTPSYRSSYLLLTD